MYFIYGVITKTCGIWERTNDNAKARIRHITSFYNNTGGWLWKISFGKKNLRKHFEWNLIVIFETNYMRMHIRGLNDNVWSYMIKRGTVKSKKMF